MNIVFVHDHKLKEKDGKYYTTGGLSDTITTRYTNFFGNMTLICRADKKDVVENNMKRIRNNNLSISPFFKKIVLPSRKNLQKIKEIIDKSDMVIIRLPSILGIYAYFLSKKSRKKILVEVVGSAFGSYWYKNILGKFLAIPLEILNKYIIGKSDYAIYVSEKYLQKEYPRKNFKFSCSDVLLENRNEEILNERLTKIEKKWNKSRIVIGTLAQIDQKYKGYETVFKVISRLKSKGILIDYMLAGSGKKDYITRIAKKYNVSDRIKVCGLIPHDRITEWLKKIDIYIQPSLTEGLPRSVIEALYYGCPTIVSSAGGMPELVENRMVFKKKNDRELEKIILNLNKKEMKEISKRNYFFSSKFDYKKLQSNRNNIFNEIKKEVLKNELV